MNFLKSKFLRVAAIAVMLVLSLAFALPQGEVAREESVESSVSFERVAPPELTLPLCKEGESTAVASNGSSVFTDILYGTAPHASVGTVGTDLEKYFYSAFKLDIFSAKYGASSPKTNVVVYGRCDIPLAARLADAVDEASVVGYAWGIAYENGTLALYASSKISLDEPDDLFPDLWSALKHYNVDGTLTLPNDLFLVYSVTNEEYDALLAQKAEDDRIKAEQERLEKIETIKNAIENEFSNSDFDPEGKGITEDMEEASEKSYADPDVYPPVGEHPRVIFTSDAIPGILESLEKTENAQYLKRLMVLVEAETDGKLPPAKEVTSGRRGFHNYDIKILGIIQAKAFYYAISGDELYGYEAIYAVMNYIKTLDLKYIFSDQTREFGYLMYIAACVYDWCYDLLSEQTKTRMTLGIEHLVCTGKSEMWELAAAGGVKMEVGFPPKGQGAVTGHGSERQILRDYLAYSIAIYDEFPLWYDFIAGRIYEEFVPVREVFYEAGLYPQGTTVYLDGRFFSDATFAMLIYGFSGKSPFTDNQKDVIPSWTAHITSGLRYFPTGDGTYSGTGSMPRSLAENALIMAYLYDDELCFNIAYNMGLSPYVTDGNVCAVTLPEFLVMNVKKDNFTLYENTKEEIPKIVYNGGYLGQYITRNSWADDAAVTFVKANVRTTANHDHDDSGTFQIYYKGFLTGDTGVYDSYGSDQHKYFHQTTVSHNGLLIVNPSKASGWYTGSQKEAREVSTLSSWLSPTYDRATVLGRAHGYDQNETPLFSYLSTDITASYASDQATYVGRTTLTAYTDDEEFPMVFFVLDRIDAPSEDRIKKFLLQIPGADAPDIDEENKTVTVVREGGKLVLNSLIGADKIEGLGGEGQNFLINGVQCAPSGSNANSWGRVEISTTGNLSDVLLNVMYVTDADNSKELTPERVSATNEDGKTVLEGASIAGITALFSTELISIGSSVTFTAHGEDYTTCYVGGLTEGTWRVSFGGEYAGTVYATHESGMVSFTAPTGVEINLAPGADIQPEGGEKIVYVTNGGDISSDADKFYFPGEELTLTTQVTREKDIFDGWYLDREFKERIDVVPVDRTGTLTVYAKWLSVFANEDYSSTSLNIENKQNGASANGIEYTHSDGALVTYKTENDGEDGYLIWASSKAGPSIFVRNKASSIASMSGSKITYIFELADAGTDTDMTVAFRVRGDKVYNNYVQEIGLLSVSGGVVKNAGVEIAKLGVDFVTVAVVLDFETGEMMAYSSKSRDTVKSTFDTSKREYFTSEILSARANSAGSIKIGSIKISEGDLGEEIRGCDIPENYIEFPPEAQLPAGTDIGFTPDGETVIPTEGIIAFEGGRYKKLGGWYSDSALTIPVTSVPNGISGKFTVYAKWVDDDYIYYPTESKLPSEKYATGDLLPENIEITVDGIQNYLVGWYTDESLSGEPVTAIPEGTVGALVLYAKWAEKSIVYFPDGSGVEPIPYTPGVTELPTEIVGFIDGFEMPLVGWYLDRELTVPVSVVPADKEGALRVYAKWEEPNYIKYPQEVILPSGAPTIYDSNGATLLPTNVTNSNNSSFKFFGWYSDSECKNPITEIPAGCEGKYEVYALWEKYLVNLEPTSNGTDGVSGYGYCTVHTDTNSDGLCDVCRYCVSVCRDGEDEDELCDACGSSLTRCGRSALDHNDADGNGRCDGCNVNLAASAAKGSLGSIGVGVSFGDFAAGSAYIVDNGDDDYIRLFSQKGDGPACSYNGSGTIYKLLKDSSSHQLVYSLELAAEEGVPLMPVHLRFKPGGTNASVLLTVSANGDIGNGAETLKGHKITTEMTKIVIVVDFDDEEIRYYVNDIVDPVMSKPWKKPTSYETTEEWLAGLYDYSTSSVMQLRFQGSGALLVGSTKIYHDAALEYEIKANKIVYPDGIELPLEAPKSYIPGETVLPTGLTNKIGGVTVGLIAWYDNPELEGTPITEIPEDATGEYRVYAKWEEPAVIAYPSSVKLPTDFVASYIPGVTTLIESPEYSGSYPAKFCGWYLDAALTQPLEGGIVPTGTSGMFTVYAKWIVDVFVADIEAAPENADSLAGSGFSANPMDGTYKYTTVDNGEDDYIRVQMDTVGGGPTLSPAKIINANDALADSERKVVTYSLKIGSYNPEALASVSMRTKIGGSTAVSLVRVNQNNGKVAIYDNKEALIAEVESGLVDVSFVVDFDNDTVRYYVNGEFVKSIAWTYELEAGTRFCQFRFNTAGSVDIAYLKISAGDAFD